MKSKSIQHSQGPQGARAELKNKITGTRNNQGSNKKNQQEVNLRGN